MSDFKGTPGPWIKEVTRNNDIIVKIPQTFGRSTIYTTLKLGHLYDDDCGNPTCCRVEEHANANLIAAAPELLKALVNLNSEIDKFWNGDKSDLRIKSICTAQQESLTVIHKSLGKENSND